MASTVEPAFLPRLQRLRLPIEVILDRLRKCIISKEGIIPEIVGQGGLLQIRGSTLARTVMSTIRRESAAASAFFCDACADFVRSQIELGTAAGSWGMSPLSTPSSPDNSAEAFLGSSSVRFALSPVDSWSETTGVSTGPSVSVRSADDGLASPSLASISDEISAALLSRKG